jgi:O-acetyl-ADP-ribose deacetylase (regulator of RNase III)
MTPTFEVVVADITTLDVDAIVNAANSGLSGGGGVDGAIHRAAGPELAPAARAAGPCPTGHAVMTAGFRLPARQVIHAVGPVWMGGLHDEDELLARCYLRSLQLAGDAALASIAFPCISTGAFGVPRERAARIAFDTVTREAPRHPTLQRVVFCCYSEGDADLYRRLLEGTGPGAHPPSGPESS